jgi:hypothetical protein
MTQVAGVSWRLLAGVRERNSRTTAAAEEIQKFWWTNDANFSHEPSTFPGTRGGFCLDAPSVPRSSHVSSDFDGSKIQS